MVKLCPQPFGWEALEGWPCRTAPSPWHDHVRGPWKGHRMPGGWLVGGLFACLLVCLSVCLLVGLFACLFV